MGEERGWDQEATEWPVTYLREQSPWTENVTEQTSRGVPRGFQSESLQKRGSAFSREQRKPVLVWCFRRPWWVRGQSESRRPIAWFIYSHVSVVSQRVENPVRSFTSCCQQQSAVGLCGPASCHSGSPSRVRFLPALSTGGVLFYVFVLFFSSSLSLAFLLPSLGFNFWGFVWQTEDKCEASC